MKMFFGSDLHLEFERGNNHTLTVPTGDVLLLAGDVFTPWKMDGNGFMVAKSFFQECSEKFKDVIMILGNHEHYGGNFYKTLEKVRNFVSEFPNVNVLNNQTLVFDDVAVFGATFWTDMRKSHPEVMWDVKRGMSDFVEVDTGVDTSPYATSRKSRLLPEDVVNENFYSKQALREFMTRCENEELFPVVLTHHQPSFACVQAQYKADTLSYAYANSDMDDLLCEFPQNVWVAGHSHKRDQMQVGNSLVLTNCRGYLDCDFNDEPFTFKQFKVNFED